MSLKPISDEITLKFFKKIYYEIRELIKGSEEFTINEKLVRSQSINCAFHIYSPKENLIMRPMITAILFKNKGKYIVGTQTAERIENTKRLLNFF